MGNSIGIRSFRILPPVATLPDNNDNGENHHKRAEDVFNWDPGKYLDNNINSDPIAIASDMGTNNQEDSEIQQESDNNYNFLENDPLIEQDDDPPDIRTEEVLMEILSSSL